MQVWRNMSRDYIRDVLRYSDNECTWSLDWCRVFADELDAPQNCIVAPPSHPTVPFPSRLTDTY